MLNNDITHPKRAETDQEAPYGARKNSVDDELDKL